MTPLKYPSSVLVTLEATGIPLISLVKARLPVIAAASLRAPEPSFTTSRLAAPLATFVRAMAAVPLISASTISPSRIIELSTALAWIVVAPVLDIATSPVTETSWAWLEPSPTQTVPSARAEPVTSLSFSVSNSLIAPCKVVAAMLPAALFGIAVGSKLVSSTSMSISTPASSVIVTLLEPALIEANSKTPAFSFL